MITVEALSREERAEYHNWILSDPVIPAGFSSLEAFKLFSHGQKKLGDY